MAVTRQLPARDILLIGFSLLAVAGLAWYYLWLMAANMQGTMPGMSDGMQMSSMMQPAVWTPKYFVMMLAMWIIMMAGMMLPAAMPVVMMYAVVLRKALEEESGEQQKALGAAFAVPVAVFVLAYLVSWSLFSVLATLLQWGLEQVGLLSTMLAAGSSGFAAAVLAAAGIYQWLPLKQACLRRCQSPAGFIARYWQRGSSGAFRIGMAHGVFCIGCCWMLMALLFVGGIMNLLWVAAITAYVLLEKLLPPGNWVPRLSGLAMLGCSAYLLLAPAAG